MKRVFLCVLSGWVHWSVKTDQVFGECTCWNGPTDLAAALKYIFHFITPRLQSNACLFVFFRFLLFYFVKNERILNYTANFLLTTVLFSGSFEVFNQLYTNWSVQYTRFQSQQSIPLEFFFHSEITETQIKVDIKARVTTTLYWLV